MKRIETELVCFNDTAGGTEILLKEKDQRIICSEEELDHIIVIAHMLVSGAELE